MSAGCDFRDVFRVNVYPADLSEWSRFGCRLREEHAYPLPVRTAVQAVLLDRYRVEIEMWR